MIEETEQLEIVRDLMQMQRAGVIGAVYVNAGRPAVLWPEDKAVPIPDAPLILDSMSWARAKKLVELWREGKPLVSYVSGLGARELGKSGAVVKTLVKSRRRREAEEQRERRRVYLREVGRRDVA